MSNRNIRLTPFRQKVLDLFNTSKSALSVRDIENKLDTFDRITLYRTLKLFTENGILHEIILPNEKKYAACHEQCSEDGHQHDHLHFHCSICKNTFCVNTTVVPIELDGFIVQSAELNVFGLCKECD